MPLKIVTSNLRLVKNMSGPTSRHSEVAGQLDLSVIRYSRVWEDYRILVKGLEISSQDSLLIITRSKHVHSDQVDYNNIKNDISVIFMAE